MMPVNFKSLSLADKQKFVDSFDNIITDCDGVLWINEEVIYNVPRTINYLNNLKKNIYFVTNNSTKTRSQFLSKFEKFGCQVNENNLLITSHLTAKYINNVLSPEKLVYVVGPEAISTELKKFNINSFGSGKDELPEDVFNPLVETQIEIRENVGAVVVGFDQHINYMKMLKAATYLKNQNCLFVCTNTDESFPSHSQVIMPGTGAILTGIKVASGREPFIIGKPSTYVSQILIEENKIDPGRTLFIGDRCNTDIIMGNKCSFKTLLVLTGVHSLEDVHKYKNSSSENDLLSVPHYYTDSFSDLLIS